MKRRVATVRLSPNEEAQLIREEKERRRKLRIQQVREQHRYIALQIRQNVEQRRQREMEQLQEELRAEWERQRDEKLQTLQRLYEQSLQLLGEGHRSAKENEPDLAAIAQKEAENHAKAEKRFREALKELKSQKMKDLERQRQSINARNKALQAERERSAKVAGLPLPPPNPVQNIDAKRPHVVKKWDVNAFAATHYHMPETAVDREVDTTQPNAREGAELETRRLQDFQREEEQKRQEQLEKARLRGKCALRREQLVLDRERFLVELEHMQQTDLLRRRQQVSQMPPQIFQPLYKRQEMRDDFQRELEFAFEDMYTGERRVKGDLVVQLVPEPLPAPSTSSQDQELDVTLDETATSGTETAQDIEQEAESEQQTLSDVEPARPAPRRALKKLLDRIRNQRNQWTSATCVPASDSVSIVPDQIPERDTTIDTGSLASEERDKPPCIKHPKPADSPLAVKPAQQPAEADSPLPDELANKIKEFEEAKKKREVELEREKQQQLTLLQELEEQKATLEQMLLEAQQEREHLKAEVAQEVSVNQPEVPVHDDVTHNTEVVPPASGDDHTRRIQEYQQQLLERNRIHQRSVEVARQRLEEYQRALQIRQNMIAASVPSAVLPPPHNPCVHPPAALQQPSTSAAPQVARQHLEEYKQALKFQQNGIPGSLPPAAVPPVPSHPPLHGSQGEHSPTLLQHHSTYAYCPSHLQRHTTSEELEAAWQHLEGYQRALQIHQNMTPTSLQSSALPPGLNHQPLPRPSCSNIPTTSVAPQVTQHLEDYPADQHMTPTSLLSTVHPPTQQPFTTAATAKPHSPAQVPTRGSDVSVSPPHLLGSSFSLCSSSVLNAMESVPNSPKSQIQDVTAQLTAGIMERVTDHLPEQLRPSSLSPESVPSKLFTVLQSTTSIPLQPAPEPIPSISRSITDGVAPDPATANGYSVTASLREDNMDRQSYEEQQKRRELEMEQMRQQKETLQALIHTDAQPVPEVTTEVVTSEDIRQTRLNLLATLLKAIEESHGGSLSHLQDPQGEDVPPPQPGLLPPRAAKPPVSRVRLGAREMMTEQHELSAIQEVETPVNISQVTGLEDVVKVPMGALDWHMQHDSNTSLASDWSSQTPSESSSGRHTAERRPGSRGSSQLVWREKLLMRAGTSPESSERDSVRRIASSLSSDSGRGADYSGPAMTTFRSPTEVAGPSEDGQNLSSPRPADSDSLSSTTISTGSYVTTDPEQNLNADKSPEEEEEGKAAVLLDVSSPFGQSSCMKEDFAADQPVLAVDSFFNDSSIQRIIDRYTRELDISLSSAGKTTDNEGSFVEGRRSSVCQQSVVGVSQGGGDDESSRGYQSLPSTAAGAERSGEKWDAAVSPIPKHLSVSHEASLTDDLGRDSFRPLIGQVADQSACLAAEPESAMDQLVGQPSAHSSMIGPLPVPPVSTSAGQDGWESILSRMIGRLSHQSSSHWLSSGQDSNVHQLTPQMEMEPSVTWLDVGPEESLMRPLVGELDESSDQQSGSSGGRTCVDPGGSAEASASSHSSHSDADPDMDPRLQSQASPVERGPERTEGFPGSDSFHPLLAEVTHNETADPSMTFHQPEHNTPSSPEQLSIGEHSEFERSPEHFREDNTPAPPAALNQSISQLITSPCPHHESDLMASAQGVEVTALALSKLTVCDAAPAFSVPQPEGGAPDRKCTCERQEESVPCCDVLARQLESAQGSSLWGAAPFLDKILEAASEKGILEQSEITLVSTTDTTLQDKDDDSSEGEGIWQDEYPEGRSGQELEETDATLMEETPEASLEDKTSTHPVTLLEFQWGPGGGPQDSCQKKLQALVQRSSRRVQEIKAKGALAKTQPDVAAPVKTREQFHTEEPPPAPWKAKTKSELQQKTKTKSKGGMSGQAVVTKQKNPLLPPSAGSVSGLMVAEVKISGSEQRKEEVSEMHKRTQRLYEQLEEVKHQRAIRSRQEACAKNRQKAKEFHMKTLQKLRAKQTRQ